MKNTFGLLLSFIATLLIFGTPPIPTFAHPGRTDSSGGHTCYTNCWRWGLAYGQYHYHNRPRYYLPPIPTPAPSPSPPAPTPIPKLFSEPKPQPPKSYQYKKRALNSYGLRKIMGIKSDVGTLEWIFSIPERWTQEHIAEVQGLLNQLGFKDYRGKTLATDGQYGLYTFTAHIKYFQKKKPDVLRESIQGLGGDIKDFPDLPQ